MNSYTVRYGLKLLLILTIYSVGLTNLALSSTAAPVRTTLCELQTHPEEFSEHMIEVRTIIVTNFEMSMLSDRSCSVSDVHVWFGGGLVDSDATEYAIIDSSESRSREHTTEWRRSPIVTFEQSKETRAMFRAMRKQEKRQGYGSATATVVGMFEYIPAGKVMVLKAADGRRWETSRFGHQLCCNARLLPVTIHDVVLSPKRSR